MKSLSLVVLCCCLFACVTEKQRLRICQTCSFSNTDKDSVRIVERIDSVFLPPIAGPIQYLENPCKELCDSLGRLKPFVLKAKKNSLNSTVKTVGNSIAIECDTDSLKAHIKTLEKYISNNKNFNNVKMIPCANERTSFDGFTRWYFYITCAIIIGWVLLRLLKLYILKF